MKSIKTSLTTAAVAAALAAMGGEAFADGDTVTTGEIMVTAGRVAQELQDVPMSVSVVTEEDIRTSTARTIGELLEDVPGVQITNSGSQGLKRVAIRGEDTFRTLVLIDGQKVGEQKSMDGTAILIDPASVERIEVIKGPASVLYGSDAIGGVVNIITKKGAGKPFEADVSLGWNGAGHGWDESATIGGTVGRLKYRVSGSYTSQDETDTPRGRLDHTAYRQKSGSMFLGYDILDNVTVGIQADLFDSHLGSGSVTYDPSDFYVDIPTWKREKVGIFLEAKNVGDYLARVRWDGYWQKTRKQMENYVRSIEGTSGMTMLSGADNRLTTLGTSLQMDWQLGENNYLITGYEFTRDKLKADTDLDMSIQMTAMVSMDYTTERYNEGTQDSHAIFASMETELPHDLVANYGVRWTYVSTEQTRADAVRNGTMSMYGTTIPYYNNYNDGSAGETGDTDNSRAVFNAGITWKGIDNLALRATWAQGFRVPLLQEKYMRNSMGGGTIYGNPDLKPETSNNFELGARYAAGPLDADATLFFSKAKNYISTEYVDSTTTRYVNADKATSFGLEMSLKYTIANHWTPYAAVTLMKRKIEGDGYSTYDSGTPEFYARYGLRTSHPAFGGTLYTDTYARSQTSTKSYSSSSGETTRVPGFTTANFTAGYAFGKNGDYTVGIEFLNIFDQLYQYNTSTYEPGRHINFKATARF